MTEDFLQINVRHQTTVAESAENTKQSFMIKTKIKKKNLLHLSMLYSNIRKSKKKNLERSQRGKTPYLQGRGKTPYLQGRKDKNYIHFLRNHTNKKRVK